MQFSLLPHKRLLIVLFVALILCSAAGIALFPQIVVGWRTAYIISHVIPRVPQWFEWKKYNITIDKFPLGDGTQSIYVYRPREKVGTIPFVLFLPGFTPEGSDDQRLVDVANSFAGAGIGAAILDSKNTRQKTFSREDVDLIKQGFSFLQNQPYVAKDRIGLAGLSIGASYTLRAASELGEAPLFVFSLGAYYDLGDLFAEIVTKKAVHGNSERPWKPDPIATAVADNVILRATNEEKKNEFLQAEKAGSLTYEQAKEFFDSFPADAKELRDSISPSRSLDRMKTRVFLMHDKNDTIVPVEESRKIRDALPKNTLVSYGELSLLNHATPKSQGSSNSADLLNFSRELFSITKLLLQEK